MNKTLDTILEQDPNLKESFSATLAPPTNLRAPALPPMLRVCTQAVCCWCPIATNYRQTKTHA